MKIKSANDAFEHLNLAAGYCHSHQNYTQYCVHKKILLSFICSNSFYFHLPLLCLVSSSRLWVCWRVIDDAQFVIHALFFPSDAWSAKNDLRPIDWWREQYFTCRCQKLKICCKKIKILTFFRKLSLVVNIIWVTKRRSHPTYFW